MTEAFARKDDRDRRAADLEKEAKANLLGQAPMRAEIAEFRAFKAAIGDADWREVVNDCGRCVKSS